jgi:hypothetical protein
VEEEEEKGGVQPGRAEAGPTPQMQRFVITSCPAFCRIAKC